MKYSRLTKEQFEALHEEFARFLAAQSITIDEWSKIKAETPEVAEQELDVFSDLIWEGVISKAEYLENVSPQQLFLFKIETEAMHLIVVKVSDTSVDITSEDGFRWLQQHIADEVVELFTASKSFSEDKNSDIFELVKQGAEICDGSLYKLFSAAIEE
jgi:hypothetical protein